MTDDEDGCFWMMMKMWVLVCVDNLLNPGNCGQFAKSQKLWTIC